MDHKIVSRDEWIAARKAFLKKEKEFTYQREALSEKRRQLPWVKVDKDYVFDGADGSQNLADLFGPHSQLVTYHFMYGPDWKEGCPSCSFWADNFNNIPVHLAHRDVRMIATSKAPYDILAAYQQRMGWTFDWFSTSGNDFSEDYQATYSPEEVKRGEAYYNYRTGPFPGEQAPGVSVFYKDPETGDIFHTYSCYARGLDMLNGAYHYLDLVPKGRDEAELPYAQAWVRRHDQYDSK